MRVYARVRVSMRGNVHAYAWICTRKQMTVHKSPLCTLQYH